MSRIASFTKTSSSSNSPVASVRIPEDLDTMSLPKEISSSIQAFLKNLQSPIHKSPFSPERLTAMFQDFYAGTNELVYDMLPEDLPGPNAPGELLSSNEMAAQKTRRLQAETKRQQWREEIEEQVCLELYEKIFELKTSTDELRDEALMSKIIAMNLIGVNLEQLGVGLSQKEWQDMQPTVTLIGEELQNLNNALSPKAKIDILIACHKQIVAEVQHTKIADELAAATEAAEEERETSTGPVTDPDASLHDRRHLGADAILPIFIFSIIKSNPAKLVSHFHYIQRFRTSTMLSGEAAYCLTNLEAAIGFLETFDDGHSQESDPLRAGILDSSFKNNVSSNSRSSSIRAGERARALSSAAQEVYDFADERMKSLGSQFGLQLGALVGRVSQSQDLEEVRSLMGLPPVSEDTVVKSAESSTRTESGSPAVNSLVKDFRSKSPSKASLSTGQTQNTKAGGSFGRLSGLGVIRNISNSFSQARAAELSRPGTRELQSVSDYNRRRSL